MERRDFLKKAGIGAAAAVAATAVNAPAVLAKKNYRWKMVTTWPPNLPVLQTGCVRLAKLVDQLSDGRLKIQVYAGGELVPPLGIFDAVSNGTVEAGSGAAQMGGWFNKKINSIEDFKGLKMRIPGLGGKVLAKAGATVVLSPGGEIFTNLERGVIDATEWVGPLHDNIMGFYQAAKYYYYPGWHEPGTYLEYFFNKKAYESLPKDLQVILDTACMANELWCLAQFDARNGAALVELLTKHKVQLLKFPDSVMKALRKLSKEVVAEQAAKDAMSKKVSAAFEAFQNQVGPWYTVSEKAYYDDIFGDYSLKG